MMGVMAPKNVPLIRLRSYKVDSNVGNIQLFNQCISMFKFGV